jgi:hypothetical protein
MKERPILFNGPMVRAVLEGRKTMTRRIAKRLLLGLPQAEMNAQCPYGQPGDRLWVRETHKGWYTYQSQQYVCYASDNSTHIVRRPEGHPEGGMLLGECHADKWRPSIHMPRWASRITLEVTGLRVERLCEITEADARAEGVECFDDTKTFRSYWDDFCVCLSAKDSFQTLWAKINGPDSWDANPWVWVVEFRRV